MSLKFHWISMEKSRDLCLVSRARFWRSIPYLYKWRQNLSTIFISATGTTIWSSKVEQLIPIAGLNISSKEAADISWISLKLITAFLSFLLSAKIAASQVGLRVCFFCSFREGSAPAHDNTCSMILMLWRLTAILLSMPSHSIRQ